MSGSANLPRIADAYALRIRTVRSAKLPASPEADCASQAFGCHTNGIFQATWLAFPSMDACHQWTCHQKSRTVDLCPESNLRSICPDTTCMQNIAVARDTAPG